MSLTKLIEDLINLAGTPKGTISDLKGGLVALRGETEALEDHVRVLEAEAEHPILAKELDRVQAALEESQQEVEHLRADAAKQKKAAAKAKQKPPKLTPDELRALQFIAGQPGHNQYGVADAFGIGEEAAMFLLGELCAKGVAERRGFHPHRWEWHPTQPGRSFLAQKGLL